MRSRPSSSCRAPRARRRSTCSTSRASATGRCRRRSCSPTQQGVDDPAVQQAMEGLFDEIEQKIPDVDVVEPVLGGRRAPDLAQRQDRVRARSTSPTARVRSSPTDGKEIKTFAEDIDVPGPARRVRRRHLRRRRDRRRERGDRPARRHHHPADRVRFGARDGPADRHRAVRHRHRHRDRAERPHRRRHARLHHRRGGDGRPRRRHRLRAVHRHAISRGPRRGRSTRSAAWSTRSTPPVARCSSPAPPS